jgi:hypothetical protein
MYTLSMRAEFDEVYASMVNGQRRQAIEQAERFGLDEVPYMLDYFTAELNQPEIALDFAKTYFRVKSR